MPFKDTPGLRRLVAAALEERDTVLVCVISPNWVYEDADGTRYREGDTLLLQRKRAQLYAEKGYVEVVDER